MKIIEANKRPDTVLPEPTFKLEGPINEELNNSSDVLNEPEVLPRLRVKLEGPNEDDTEDDEDNFLIEEDDLPGLKSLLMGPKDDDTEEDIEDAFRKTAFNRQFFGQEKNPDDYLLVLPLQFRFLRKDHPVWINEDFK